MATSQLRQRRRHAHHANRAIGPARVKARRWRWPESQRAGWDQRAMPRTAGRLPGARSHGPRCGGARRLRGHPTARSLTGPVTSLRSASTTSAPGGEGAGFIPPVGRVGCQGMRAPSREAPAFACPWRSSSSPVPHKAGCPPGNPGSCSGGLVFTPVLGGDPARPGDCHRGKHRPPAETLAVKARIGYSTGGTPGPMAPVAPGGPRP